MPLNNSWQSKYNTKQNASSVIDDKYFSNKWYWNVFYVLMDVCLCYMLLYYNVSNRISQQRQTIVHLQISTVLSRHW